MVHTPYDGSARPFTIGLKPLDPKDWIDVDDHFGSYIAEKKRLYTDEFENVLAAEAGTEDAQGEVLELLLAQCSQHASSPRKRETRLSALSMVKSLGPRFRGDDCIRNIAAAGLLVQEDLVLMRKSVQGWRLVAASLCFPSAWNLREKFGKPLAEVHGPVPGFNAGTRNAEMIERMFDKLSTLVVRWNWSLYGESKLFYPGTIHGATWRFGEGDDIAGRVFFRLERQTLRKLPISGDILFTIRIYLDPLEVLERHSDGAQLARAIADQLVALSPAEIDYKGLTMERPRLLARLAQISSNAKENTI